MEENWLPVKGYEGLYEVSDWGNVRSLNYLGHVGKVQKLKVKKNNGGYLQVCLTKGGERKFKFVHRLVAEAFIPNPKQEVNHKSECKMLNFACVLEWISPRENTNYGTGIQRRADSQSKSVVQFDNDGNFIKQWKSLSEASRQLGIGIGSISKSCRVGAHAGGFFWKYAP